MFHPGTQKTDSDVEYLEYRLEQYQEDERQRQDEAEAARRQREEERKERYEEDARTAETWPEALQKQASLFRREARPMPGDSPDYRDDFFGPGADACERALEIWSEVEAARKAKIEALQTELAIIQDEIRLETARRLAEESGILGWQSIATAIKENDDLGNWLNW